MKLMTSKLGQMFIPFQKKILSQGAVPLELPWKSQTIRDDFRKFGDQLLLSLVPTKKREQNLRFWKERFIIYH